MHWTGKCSSHRLHFSITSSFYESFKLFFYALQKFVTSFASCLDPTICKCTSTPNLFRKETCVCSHANIVAQKWYYHHNCCMRWVSSLSEFMDLNNHTRNKWKTGRDKEFILHATNELVIYGNLCRMKFQTQINLVQLKALEKYQSGMREKTDCWEIWRWASISW